MRSLSLLILSCYVLDVTVAVAAHAMGSNLVRHSGAFLQRASTQQESIGRLIASQDVNKSLRITFLHDSQAGTCGLSSSLPAIFEEDGFATCTRGAGYLCVKKVGAGIPCQPFSSSTYLSTGCSAQCSDIYIHWVGINDAKAANNDAMSLKLDLLSWKEQVRAKCGQHTGLVFVQPPISEISADISGEFTYDIRGLQATIASAYVAVTEGDTRAVRIDSQILSDWKDFHHPHHFCANAVPCVTSRNIGGAIYEAVNQLSSASNVNRSMDWGALPVLFNGISSYVSNLFSVMGSRVLEAMAFPSAPLMTLVRTLIAGLVMGLLAGVAGKRKTERGRFLETFAWNQNGREPLKVWGGVVRTLFFPSLAEEIVWRAAVLPRPAELEAGTSQIVSILFWSVIFVDMHVWPMPNILDILPGRMRQSGAFEVFREPMFLLQVCILNGIMVVVYFWDGTIWPCVVLHWLAVVTMQWGYGYDKKLAPHLDWPDTSKSKLSGLTESRSSYEDETDDGDDESSST